MDNATIRILGDGNVLGTFALQATAMPISFSVSVEGVQQLRIEVSFPSAEGQWGANLRGGSADRASRYIIQGFLER